MTRYLIVLIAFVGLSLGGAGCRSNSITSHDPQQGLAGNWRLVETAYSGPVDQLITNSVPPVPLQLLVLNKTGQVMVQGNALGSLRQYTMYQIDSTQTILGYNKRLAFQPELSTDDKRTNFIQLTGDTLHLVRPGRGASYLAFVRMN